MSDKLLEDNYTGPSPENKVQAPLVIAEGPERAIMRAADALTLTPAQARVESVARTMDAAMNRASTLTLTPEENAALEADFPDEAFKPGAAGKENLIYIEHAFLRDRFNKVIGRGQWALLRTRPHWAEEFETTKREKAVRIYADCALLVRGCMVAEAIGEMVYYPNNASQNYGDAAEGAVTAAFRRCAKNFGVGLQAWKKDFCEAWWERRHQGQRKQRTTPAPQPSKTFHVEPAASAIPATSRTFKNATERKAALDLHLEKCKLKLISTMEIQGVGVTKEFLEKTGHIMPLETTADANVLTLFKSIPVAPADRESDGDWWARVQEAVARDAKQIQRDFDSFARGDQLEGAEAPEPDKPVIPANAKEISGFIKLVNKKPTSKGGTKYGILIVDDMQDREGGTWYNTFDDKDGSIAESLKGAEVAIAYTEGQYGNDLCKHAIREVK